VRLGFAIGGGDDIAALSALTGPWPISGAAIAVGRRALRDRDWATATAIRLARDSVRLDEIVTRQGWRLLGGTPLFRLYDVGDGLAAQERLARAQIWSRVFTQHPTWLRLGLPGDEIEWTRLAAALSR
jgi:cobalamin biosynthetic protein CobC